MYAEHVEEKVAIRLLLRDVLLELAVVSNEHLQEPSLLPPHLYKENLIHETLKCLYEIYCIKLTIIQIERQSARRKTAQLSNHR